MPKMRRKNVDEKFIRECVIEAFDILRKEKPFSEISVTEICEKAGIGRTSFYRHFMLSDGKKQIVLEKIALTWEKYAAQNQKEVEENKGRAFVHYIFEERELFKWLIANGLSEVLFEILYSTTVNAEKNKNQFSQSFLAGGIFGLIFQWVKNDFQNPPEEIERQFAENSPY